MGFPQRHAWCCLLEESVVEIERECPRKMAAKRREVKEQGQSPQYSKENDVVDHYSPLLERLRLSCCTRNPVGRIVLHHLVHFSQVFIRTVVGGGTFAPKRSNGHRQHSAD